jgi:hypothetical protein
LSPLLFIRFCRQSNLHCVINNKIHEFVKSLTGMSTWPRRMVRYLTNPDLPLYPNRQLFIKPYRDCGALLQKPEDEMNRCKKGFPASTTASSAGHSVAIAG